MYAIFIVAIVILSSIITKMTTKNWANPAVIMNTYWSIFIITSFFAFTGKYNWSYYGILWIVFACFFFTAGTLIGRGYKKKDKGKKINGSNGVVETELSSISWTFVIASIVIGSFRFIFEVIKNGFSLGMFLNLNNLVSMNTTMAQQRYLGGGSSYGILMQIMLPFVYVAPLLGGYAYIFANNKRLKIITIMTFLPILGIVLFTNGKAGLIASVFLWASGFIVANFKKYGRPPKIKIKKILVLIIFMIGLFSLLYFSMLLRIGSFSASTRATVNEKFITYALGHMPAFDSWYSSFSSSEGFTFGSTTFIGFLNMLGLSSRSQGLYSEAIVISNNIVTNVFTVNRGLISDYGRFGALVFYFIFGIFSGYFYNNVIIYKSNNNFSTVMLVATYFFILHSIFSSSWTYSSYILVFPLFYVYLLLASSGRIRLLKRKRNK